MIINTGNFTVNLGAIPTQPAYIQLENNASNCSGGCIIYNGIGTRRVGIYTEINATSASIQLRAPEIDLGIISKSDNKDVYINYNGTSRYICTGISVNGNAVQIAPSGANGIIDINESIKYHYNNYGYNYFLPLSGGTMHLPAAIQWSRNGCQRK